MSETWPLQITSVLRAIPWVPVGKVHEVAPIAQDSQVKHDKVEDKGASAG